MTAVLVGIVVVLAGVFALLAWLGPPKQNTLAAPAPQKRLVTTTTDSGPGSLQEAILDSPNGATITFATNLSGARITLTNAELALNRNFTIDASALPGGLHINGNRAGRIFNVAAQTVQVLDSLTLTNGYLADSKGAGILNAGRLTVTRCTLAGNSAFSGGAIFSSGPLVVRQSLLWRNNARVGGGLLSENGELTVENSTFTGNTAQTGGGLSFSSPDSVVVFAHVTVVSNTATDTAIGGGGISAAYFRGATLQNCIIAGNRGSPIADIRSEGFQFTSIGGNLTGNGLGLNCVPSAADQVGSEESPRAPQLAPLGQFGVPTQTMPPLPGSPALDFGSSTTTLTNDQRGWPRVVGSLADAGAVEAEAPGTRPLAAKRPVVTHVVTTTADEGSGSLRKALADARSGDTVTFATNLSGATSEVSLYNTIVADNTPDNISGPYTSTGVNFTEGNPDLAPLPNSPVFDGCTNGSIFNNDQRYQPRNLYTAPDIGAVEYRRPN